MCGAHTQESFSQILVLSKRTKVMHNLRHYLLLPSKHLHNPQQRTVTYSAPNQSIILQRNQARSNVLLQAF